MLKFKDFLNFQTQERILIFELLLVQNPGMIPSFFLPLLVQNPGATPDFWIHIVLLAILNLY